TLSLPQHRPHPQALLLGHLPGLAAGGWPESQPARFLSPLLLRGPGLCLAAGEPGGARNPTPPGCPRDGSHRRIAVAFVVCLLCVPGFMLGEDKDKDETSEKRVGIKCLVPENKIADVSKNLNLEAEHPTETRGGFFLHKFEHTL